jgi:CRISPR-associated protein Csd1
MLLRALYDYSQKHKLFESLPLQKRIVHFLIPLTKDGTLREDILVPLMHTNTRGKEEVGQERLMPRFPGENNGGKAYFLAEGTVAILGCDKDTGAPIPAPSDKKMKNPTKAFIHFWQQIEKAFNATRDTRLRAVLDFRKKYICFDSGLIQCKAQLITIEDGKLYGIVGQGKKHALKTATIGFQIDGNPLTLEDSVDNLREYWFSDFTHNAFTVDDHDEEIAESNPACRTRPTICLITGETGVRIARSHKPKILGIPGLASGGYIVSFAKEAPAFSSYGFEMGQNAPISEKAAASYALAANDILFDDDMHLNLGPVSVCFWSKEIQEVPKQFNLLLNKAYPEQVAKFLKSPFAGIANREVINRDKLHTIAFAGNAGRVVVQYWLEQPLFSAIKSFARWWEHLDIISLYQNDGSVESDKKIENVFSPFSIPNLARVCIRQSKKYKDDKLIAERIVRLYRAAMEGLSLPITLLKTVLDEFHSALVKNSDEKPTYPFSQSRFALIKLILIRNRKEGAFMPTYELADTSDEAYNLGRLLAVFENLQDKYHNYEKKGAGIVERYYGTASSAPASAFPILCRLARHHLSKVRKEDGAAAYRIEERVTEILAKFKSKENGKPPLFPRILPLEEQGRFALGFYQQKAQSILDKQNKRDNKDNQ